MLCAAITLIARDIQGMRMGVGVGREGLQCKTRKSQAVDADAGMLFHLVEISRSLRSCSLECELEYLSVTAVERTTTRNYHPSDVSVLHTLRDIGDTEETYVQFV